MGVCVMQDTTSSRCATLVARASAAEVCVSAEAVIATHPFTDDAVRTMFMDEAGEQARSTKALQRLSHVLYLGLHRQT